MTNRQTRTASTFAAVVAAVLSISAVGCCKKDWPGTADSDEDRRELIKQVALPAAVHAEPLVVAPMVLVVHDEIRVDGTPAGRFGAEPETQELGALLKDKREQWERGNPGKPSPGIVTLAAGRELDGARVAAIASTAARAGYAKLGVVVHATRKGKLAPENLGMVTVKVHLGYDLGPLGSRDGLRLHLGPMDMAVVLRTTGGMESSPEPVAMAEDEGVEGVSRLPGLQAAVDRAPGKTRYAVVSGMDRVSLKKLVGICDVFEDPRRAYETVFLVPST